MSSFNVDINQINIVGLGLLLKGVFMSTEFNNLASFKVG